MIPHTVTVRDLEFDTGLLSLFGTDESMVAKQFVYQMENLKIWISFAAPSSLNLAKP